MDHKNLSNVATGGEEEMHDDIAQLAASQSSLGPLYLISIPRSPRSQKHCVSIAICRCTSSDAVKNESDLQLGKEKLAKIMKSQ